MKWKTLSGTMDFLLYNRCSKIAYYSYRLVVVFTKHATNVDKYKPDLTHPIIQRSPNVVQSKVLTSCKFI